MDREDWMFRITYEDDGTVATQEWRCGQCGRREAFVGSTIPGHTVVMDPARSDSPYLGGYTRLECHMEPVSFV